MDEKKLVKLDIENKERLIEHSNKNVRSSLFQTNPILQKMFSVNMTNKKSKFNFNDLFR